MIEQALLGAILIDGDLIKETSLLPQHFNGRHRIIFEAMKNVNEKDCPVDMVSVTAELDDALEQVGNVSYLSELASSVPTTSNFKHYERLLLEKYSVREATNIAKGFAESPTNDGLAKMLDDLTALEELTAKKKEVDKRELLVEIIHDMHEEQETIAGVNTGSIGLNKMTGGWQDGDLIIVAARPSVGKTAFALSLASAHCETGGVSDIFSLEMSAKQLMHRFLSQVGGIDSYKWRQPSKLLDANDYEKATHAIGVLEQWEFNIYDDPIQTVSSIRASARKLIKKTPGKKHLILIDYLQLMTANGKYENRNLEIGYITRNLKALARELSVPVVLLSQLSRDVEKRQNKRPMLSDLRDSGSIEQDADVVAFLYRDDYYDRETENQNIIEVILGKQRNGDVGTVEMVFNKQNGRFLDIERHREEL